ncbi:hypothetical protein AHAS_Ahas05G0295500 [Arachis hypogaea]
MLLKMSKKQSLRRFLEARSMLWSWILAQWNLSGNSHRSLIPLFSHAFVVCLLLVFLRNNARILATPFMLSKDNIELQFATNHLGNACGTLTYSFSDLRYVWYQDGSVNVEGPPCPHLFTRYSDSGPQHLHKLDTVPEFAPYV